MKRESTKYLRTPTMYETHEYKYERVLTNDQEPTFRKAPRRPLAARHHHEERSRRVKVSSSPGCHHPGVISAPVRHHPGIIFLNLYSARV